MTDQPAPPPVLDKKHDAETLALLDTLDASIDTLETQVTKLKEQRKALRDHLGVRIGGDLRPRVLAYQDTTSRQEQRLVVAETKLGITPPKA